MLQQLFTNIKKRLNYQQLHEVRLYMQSYLAQREQTLLCKYLLHDII